MLIPSAIRHRRLPRLVGPQAQWRLWQEFMTGLQTRQLTLKSRRTSEDLRARHAGSAKLCFWTELLGHAPGFGHLQVACPPLTDAPPSPNWIGQEVSTLYGAGSNPAGGATQLQSQ